MVTFSVNVIIDKPVNIVVEALMNPDNFVYWQKGLEKFEVIERTPGETGSVAHLHYVEKNRKYVMEDRMIYCEPGKKYVSRVSGDAITAEVETALNSLNDKTEMSIKWSGSGKILILKLLLPLLRGRLIKQSRSELETFKNLIETRGPDFKKV